MTRARRRRTCRAAGSAAETTRPCCCGPSGCNTAGAPFVALGTWGIFVLVLVLLLLAGHVAVARQTVHVAGLCLRLTSLVVRWSIWRVRWNGHGAVHTELEGAARTSCAASLCLQVCAGRRDVRKASPALKRLEPPRLGAAALATPETLLFFSVVVRPLAGCRSSAVALAFAWLSLRVALVVRVLLVAFGRSAASGTAKPAGQTPDQSLSGEREKRARGKKNKGQLVPQTRQKKR